MLVKAKKIINSKVITQSGQHLGKVVDFNVEAASQKISQYYVSGEFLAFLKEPLIIEARQVIEIRENEIIVEDAVVLEQTAEKKVAPNVEYVK